MLINQLSDDTAVLIERYTVYILASLIFAFASSVLLGWHMNWIYLIQYELNTAAMVYNTAVGFMLMAVSIVLLLRGYRYFSQMLLLFVMIISTLILIQHYFAINLYIDEFLFKHYENSANPMPGRMAPNTAVCFILSSLSLLMLSTKALRLRYVVLSSTFVVLTFLVAILFLMGYLSHIPNLYQWGNKTPMALNTAIGFIILSLCLMLMTVYLATKNRYKISVFFPCILTSSLLITIALLSYALYKYQIKVEQQSYLALSVFIVGSIFSVLLGLLLRFAQHMSLSAAVEKKALSLTKATLEATADGILVVDLHGKIENCNHQFYKMWSISVDKSLYGEDYDELYKTLLQQVHDQEKWLLQKEKIKKYPHETFIHVLRLKNGNIFEQTIKPQYLEQKIVGRVLCFHDITMQKQLEDQLLKHATHDPLTGLPNRALLVSLIERTILKAKKNHKILSLMIINLDRFSIVNDAFGRIKGDEFLKMVAHRLKNYLVDGIIFGRLAGDEFVLVIDDLMRVEESIWYVKKIMEALVEPITFYEYQLNTTCSIGISFYPKDGQDVDALLAHADFAMGRVKQQGRNSFQFYTTDMNTYTLDNIQLENELRVALTKQEFTLYYQPIFDLQKVKLVGFEALIRWAHPERGLIYPLDFIPLAEEIGLIRDIGDWVILKACQQLQEWKEIGYHSVKVSVNVSSVQFKSSHLEKSVSHALSQTGLTASALELELTETVLLEESEEVAVTLSQLKAMGINISIDDFGTRYSCLNYLKQFHIDKLKIDRSFVMELPDNNEDLTLVKTIIGMAKSFKIDVVAEGIETDTQLNLLKQLGCELGQGYYFAKPMPAAQCLELLKQYRSMNEPS